MDFDLLISESANFVVFNCDASPKRVLTGAVSYGVGLSEFVDLYDQRGKKVCEVAIPSETRRANTPGVLSSDNDDIAFFVKTWYL